MKTLIIARHGYYDLSGGLTHDGKTQMEKLAEKFKKYVDGGTTVILTSTAPRASQSANILARILGLKPLPLEVLWSDDCHRENPDAVLKIIKKKMKFDVVILVTHLEYSAVLPRKFGKEVLGGVSFPFGETEKGEAHVIDCEKKTHITVSGI